MSNSPLVTYKRLSKNYSYRLHKKDTITIHCYVGQVTAKQGCDYFATTDRQVSATYVIGYDGSMGQSVDEKYRPWTSSNRSNDHRAITIEVACDTKPPYKVTDEAYKALIELVADICKRNKIKELKWEADKSLIGKVKKQNMTVHRWFANTDCPGEYLYSRMGDIADKVNKKLKQYGKVVGVPAPCRWKANVKSKVKGRFAVGSKVEILKKVNDNWYRVKGKNLKGKTIKGFVYRKRIRVVK